MRIYVADDVLTDWTHGMVVVVIDCDAEICERELRTRIYELLIREDTLGESYAQEVAFGGSWMDHGEAAGTERVIGICWGGA